jgi:gas vesicle protein
MKQELVKDIANTILHFREHEKCFQTVEEMKEAISNEVMTRCSGNKPEVYKLVQKEIENANEWYDKVMEYDY